MPLPAQVTSALALLLVTGSAAAGDERLLCEEKWATGTFYAAGPGGWDTGELVPQDGFVIEKIGIRATLSPVGEVSSGFPPAECDEFLDGDLRCNAGTFFYDSSDRIFTNQTFFEGWVMFSAGDCQPF